MTPRLLKLVAEWRQLVEWAAQCHLQGWHWAAGVLWQAAFDVLRCINECQDIERN